MEKLKDYWPLLTIFLIALGYMESVIYYKEFNLNILPYLDISDIFQIQFAFYNAVWSSSIISFLFILSLYQIGQNIGFTGNITAFINFILNSAKVGKLSVFFFTVTLIQFASILLGRHYAKKILSGKAKFETIAIINDATVKTDKVNMLIGQTKSYIFFYNRSSKQTTVYRISDIKEIKFSEGIDHSNER